MSTKTEILRKIEDLFYQKSFSDLSMDEIAKTLGMKKSSLYYHFPSKEAMFLEILRNSFERHRLPTLDVLSQKPENLIRGLVESASENRNLFSIASQKGYCKIDSVRNEIASLKSTLGQECSEAFERRFGWSKTKSELFLSLCDALAQKRCSGDCSTPLSDATVKETVSAFFQ